MRRLLACALLLGLVAAAPDPGLELRIDRSTFELSARDQRDGSEGPRLPVALGSPAHPTPAGRFSAHAVILNPAWHPTPRARGNGAQARPASSDGPMGVAKIPFAQGGEIALHGGGRPILLGKPISNGCVRASDRDLLALLDWLDARGALGPRRPQADGETERAFRRPVHVIVR
jgi:hypothetical protein